MPISSSRVRKVFPVPVLPKTPALRWTSPSMSRHSLVSMSSGLPMKKCLSSSVPKMIWTSRSDARDTAEKCAGTVFAGCGPSIASIGSATRVSSGSTSTMPKAVVPETTSAMYGSETSGGFSRRVGSVEPRETSVTTPKKRIRSPSMVTYRPTRISSMETAGSSLTSTPSPSEPETTIPRRAVRPPRGAAPSVSKRTISRRAS